MPQQQFPTTALIFLSHEDLDHEYIVNNSQFDVAKISLEDYLAISEIIAEKLNDGFIPLLKETIIEFYTDHK